MSAAKFDINIDQGADFYLLLTLSDSTGNLMDLTSFVFVSELKRNISDPSAIVSFTFNILDQVANKGQVEMTMAKALIATIPLDPQNFPDRNPEEFCYDIYMTDTTPFTERIIQGSAFVSPGVSV
jgi:hypothetical protein